MAAFWRFIGPNLYVLNLTSHRHDECTLALTLHTYEDIYYLNFKDDKLWQKLLGGFNQLYNKLHVVIEPCFMSTVYGSFVLEAVQTAMTAADLCFWFV